MSIGTLRDIITKARKLSGTATDFQLTDAQIIDYINSFYLYDFPAQFRSLKLKDEYYFTTKQGQDVYPFDSEGYTTVQGPVYCEQRPISLYHTPENFWPLWQYWQFTETVDQGDGTQGPYSGTLQSVPIIRSANNNPSNITYPISRMMNILFTANNTANFTTYNITDDGNGNLITIDMDGVADGTPVGTINYRTGAFTFTLPVGKTVTAGNDIIAEYNPTNMAMPQAILFFQNQFTLRPVPDKGYAISLVAYRQPSQALLKSTEGTSDFTGVPELIEWWECLACGAAKKIYEDRLDTDGIAVMDKMLEERYQVAYTRTWAELGKQQTSTIFRAQLNNTYQVGYGWFGGGN